MMIITNNLQQLMFMMSSVKQNLPTNDFQHWTLIFIPHLVKWQDLQKLIPSHIYIYTHTKGKIKKKKKERTKVL